MKTTVHPKGRLLLCACLALSAVLHTNKSHAQLASFTRAYDANNFTLLQRNNTNMMVTPYYGRPISPFDDRGYLIASNIDNGNGVFTVKLTAVKANGDQLWTQSYGDWQTTVRCFAITRDARDNGYVLTGYRSTPITAKRRDALWLLKVDASGNPLKEYTFSADSIPCTKGSGPIVALCHSFARPSYYGLDILQVANDPDSAKNGDFVICGFVSESSAVENYAVLKRNFVWRFRLATGGPVDTFAPADPLTRFLKVYHSWGNAGSDNEPTSEDFATDVQEIAGHGIMVLGHVTGAPVTPTPPSVPRRPYYALMNYNGGGISTVPAAVFQYSNYANTPDIKNVRSLYGKDDVIYLLNYYYPTHSFAITPVKTTSGGAGLTRIYYSPDATDVPAFSMYQNTTNSDELVVMGYRLKLLAIDDQARNNFLHPYTIKVSKDGRILSKFNLDSIKSIGYINYAPASPDSNRDYFRPFEKVFPLAGIPNIGMLNTHLAKDDAEVTSALYGTTSGAGSKYYATLSQFNLITNAAECHPYRLSPEKDSVLLPYNEVVFNINNIAFKVTRFNTTVTQVGEDHKCSEIPAQRAVANAVVPAVKDDIYIYPNPAADVLNLQSLTGSSYTYKVTDLTGAVVYTGSFSYTAAVPVANWSAGIYLVHITGAGGEQQVYKFVKQ